MSVKQSKMLPNSAHCAAAGGVGIAAICICRGLGDTIPALLATAKICDQPTFSMPIDLVQVAASADWWRMVTGKQSHVPPSS